MKHFISISATVIALSLLTSCSSSSSNSSAYEENSSQEQVKNSVSFEGGSNACTLCRTTYCSGYNGKREMNARCQNSSCGHTWQQHAW